MGECAPARVLIAGGGVAALEALLALRALASDAVDLRLLAPAPSFTYRPLAVLEPFAPGEIVPSLSLPEIAEEHGAMLIVDALASVDVDRRMAATRDGLDLPYDELLVAVGARPEAAIPGTLTFGAPHAAAAIAAVVDGVREGTVRRVAFAVPAGIAWTLPLYELALRLGAERDARGRPPELLLVTPEHAPLEAFGTQVAAAVGEALEEREVCVRTASAVEAYEGGLLWIEGEGAVEVDAAIALPRLRGPRVPGLPADDEGFVPVDGYACVLGEDGVHAAGDATTQPLKQGGLAARHADVAAADLVWQLGVGLRPAPSPTSRCGGRRPRSRPATSPRTSLSAC
jgi:sulfide:quinone oxidoreductase